MFRPLQAAVRTLPQRCFAAAGEGRVRSERIVLANLPQAYLEPQLREHLAPFCTVTQVLSAFRGTATLLVEPKGLAPSALVQAITGSQFQGRSLVARVQGQSLAASVSPHTPSSFTSTTTRSDVDPEEEDDEPDAPSLQVSPLDFSLLFAPWAPSEVLNFAPPDLPESDLWLLPGEYGVFEEDIDGTYATSEGVARSAPANVRELRAQVEGGHFEVPRSCPPSDLLSAPSLKGLVVRCSCVGANGTRLVRPVC